MRHGGQGLMEDLVGAECVGASVWVFMDVGCLAFPSVFPISSVRICSLPSRATREGVVGPVLTRPSDSLQGPSRAIWTQLCSCPGSLIPKSAPHLLRPTLPFHSVLQHLWSIYSVPGAVPGIGDSAVNQTDKIFALMALTF